MSVILFCPFNGEIATTTVQCVQCGYVFSKGTRQVCELQAYCEDGE